MREELNHNLEIRGVSVASAIDRVEAELGRWQCGEYSHITRAVAVQQSRIISLEAIFSQPSQSKPVPAAIALVHFFFDVATAGLTYQFEEEHVQHEVGGMCLAEGRFQSWLDRIIGDKLEVRQLHDLATPFERTRLVPPAVYRDEEAREVLQEVPGEEDRAQREQPPAPDGSAGLQDASEKLPLSNLLENIFDAADEDREFELTHKEVADLLYATPLGLADWDVKLLLTTATELETGRVEYKPFVQAAPEIVEALLKRRVAFESRTAGAAQVPMDSIELCYWEEIEEVARAARDAFVSRDSTQQGALSRHEFRTCLSQRGDRFSPQEVQMLMQMCKEDESGMVGYEDIAALLMQLRMDALHNALVETDVQSLMIHLIRLCHREGMNSDNILYIWELRNVLLNADQLCLSRMQIHVILMIVHPNEAGEVDVEYFLRVCCTVIPYMFDTGAFAETAAQIQKDKQDAIAKQELEELQGFAGNSMANRKRTQEDEDQEESQANAPDREFVEKELQLKAGADPYPTPGKFIALLLGESLQHLQLSDAELRGFIAEAEFNEQNKDKIAFVEHIKTWVPILFELRKARIYEPILTKDWGAYATHLVDISALGARAWLQPEGDTTNDGKGSDRSVASSRKSSRGRRPGSGKRIRDRLGRVVRRSMSRQGTHNSFPQSDSDSGGSVASSHASGRSARSSGRPTSASRRASSKRHGSKFAGAVRGASKAR